MCDWENQRLLKTRRRECTALQSSPPPRSPAPFAPRSRRGSPEEPLDLLHRVMFLVPAAGADTGRDTEAGIEDSRGPARESQQMVAAQAEQEHCLRLHLATVASAVRPRFGPAQGASRSRRASRSKKVSS